MKRDYEMPAAPESEGNESDEFDFEFEGEEGEEGEGSSKLADFSDDELIEEMKSRGYEYDESEMEDEEPSEESEEPSEEMDMSMFEA